MVQIARPASTTTAGDWRTQSNGTDLHTAIDEVTFSDSDYITSPINPNGTVSTIAFGSLTDPQSSSGHVLRFRHARDAAGGTAVDIVVALWQTGGGAAIASTTVQPSGTTYTAGSISLTGTQADAITNYGQLELRVSATGGSGSPANRRAGRISWAEFEVPDAPSGQQYNQSVSGSLSFTGVIAKRAGRALSATLGFSGAITRRVERTLTASLGFGGQVSRSTSRSMTADLGLDGTVLKLTARSTSGSLDFSTSFSAQLVVPETPALIAIHIHPE